MAPIVPFKVHISDTVLHDLTVAWIKQGGQSTAWDDLGEWGRKRHDAPMELEGIVSKRLGSKYRSGRSPDWLKFKNPAAPAVRREVEVDWGRSGGDENPHALWPSH